MVSKEQIERFLGAKKIALAGVSRNSKKFPNMVMRDLEERGYMIYPINPNTEVVEGKECYSGVKELPVDVEHLLIITSKKDSFTVLKDIPETSIKSVWIQQMSDTPECKPFAEERDIELITGECIYMFANPVKGIHGFHRFLAGMFGKLPK